MNKRETTAYHEAGHAVAAVLVGRALVEVSIISDDQSDGSAIYDSDSEQGDAMSPSTEKDHAYIDNVIITALAGITAQRLQFGRGDRLGASKDHESAVRLARRRVINGDLDEIKLYLKWLTNRTRNLMSQPASRTAVNLVAASLLERERITANEVRLYVDEARRIWEGPTESD